MDTTQHVALPGSRRIPLPGAKALGPVNPNRVVELLIKVRRKTEIGELDSRPEPTPRDRVGNTYGADPKDIDRVVQSLKKYGFEVTSTNAAARSVVVAGSAADIEKTFKVSLFNYAHPDGNYRGRVGDVYIPAELQGIVVGVFGFDNRRVAHRRRHAGGQAVSFRRDMSSIPSSWYLPADLARRYSYPEGDGAGQTIGILEFGGGYFPADLQNFCNLAKISMPQVETVSVDGTLTNAADGAEGEVMLDIEVIAGICPKSTIVAYFSSFSERGWVQALDAAIHGTTYKPTVLSVSWGWAEDMDVWTEQAMTQTNESLKDAALAGITVCVAAGDDGSSDAIIADGMAHADFPASSPYVLAVGGTSIPRKDGPPPDIVWFEGNGLREPDNQDSGSSGGGVSSVFARPSWQQTVTIPSVNPNGIVGRCLPDLAANADWTASPYLLCVDNGIEPNGGTSAAAPLVAALIALINANAPAGSTVGYLTPLLYEAGAGGKPLGASVCTDIVSGQNATAKIGGYAAQSGYDAVSGWGTPIGTKLLGALFAKAEPTKTLADA